MGDGRALQAATSHDLGQNFSRAFDITFLDEQQERQYAHQTSWGFSTRTIGGLILVHGDDRGLKLPPKLAPTEGVIVPIWRGQNKAEVRREAEKLRVELGPKDIENEQAVLVRRDVAGKEGKEFVPRAALPERLRALLAEIQDNMLRQATEFRDENTRRAESYGEFK